MKSRFMSGQGLCVLSALMTVPVCALADDNRIKIAEGITLTPTLALSESYDDNIYQANTAGDSSSWVTTINPKLLFDALQGMNHYQFEYSANTDIFKQNPQEDDTDHHVRGHTVFGINRNNRVELSAKYDKVETVSDTTVVGINDKFESSSVSALYGFGTPRSPVSVDVGVSTGWFRSFNDGTTNLSREYDRKGLNVIGYYLVSPKVRALAEYRHDDYDYLLSDSLLDSEKDTYLAGLTWTATARTVGTVKFGLEDRDFNDSGRDDSDGTSWEATLNWQPSKVDTLVFNTFKGTREGSIEEDFVDATSYSVAWNRQFSPRLTTDLSFSVDDESYENQLNREDDVNGFGARINYEFSQWVTIGAGYRYMDRDSNISERSFDRNLYTLNLNLSL